VALAVVGIGVSGDDYGHDDIGGSVRGLAGLLERCTRLVAAGSLAFTGHSGPNQLAFQGRLSAASKLKLGGYTLTIVAISPFGQKSTPRTLRFQIVSR
jgi:hypothetical protein